MSEAGLEVVDSEEDTKNRTVITATCGTEDLVSIFSVVRLYNTVM